ncbi:MAG: acetate--CoA ligase family protein [Myxococcales bacterium]|nr:acetate--CoA ligase family protein [Myxococcales bacterium]
MIDPSTALLSGAAGGAVLVCDDVDDAFACPHEQRVSTRELAERLALGDVAVVATRTPSASLVRALRRDPPGLLVITGSTNPLAGDESFARATLTLGPEAAAWVHVDGGPFLLCAATRAELEALSRVIGRERVRLALCPTPPWLLRWLQQTDSPLSRLVPLGYVAVEALSTPWARWYREAALAALRRDGPHPVLVPLGLREPPEVDQALDPRLASFAAAHALECLTGPVFPAPTVVSALAQARDFADAPTVASEEALALWSQARRAVPLLGATVGMERPRAGLPLTVPTAAFLAQRPLLRRASARAMLDELAASGRSSPLVGDDAPGDDAPGDALDDDERAEQDRELRSRAREVLRGAGPVLSEHESKVVLRGFGIEITRQAVASSASGAAHFAERIGFPVVLKAVSPDLRRKQELGAVALDQATAASVRRAYSTILRNVEQHAPTARLDGVLVAEQIGEGLEIECGVVRMDDDAFAIYGRAVGVPTPQEFVLAPAPLTPEFALLLATAVLAQVPVPALRRRADPAPEELAALLTRLNALTEACGDRLLSVELNPIRLVGPPRGYVTLDARIVQRAHLDGL